LYNLAEGLVYPSRLPGVELPPYEALACGTAVITSLEENIADAGVLIDPDSPAELCAAMRRVWETPALRAQLCEKGMARAREFTWERTARETLSVYHEVAG
jgi:glycosyltransferase involved in cell wall biosynthesis